MAHRTLIDGAVYDFKGGKDLIDGTTYKQKKGRTLIAGTGYDISLGPTVYTLTLSGADENNYVTYEGVNYTAAGTVDVAVGDSVTVTATSSSTLRFSYIYLNGAEVASGRPSASYTYMPMGNATVSYVETQTNKCNITES